MKDAEHRIPAPLDDPVPTHDVADAWRLDLEASGLPIPLSPPTDDRWALCLRIGTVLTRLATLPPRERRAYARSTRPMWESARESTGEDRFLTVARVMEEWTGAAPPLPQFRELLWAVEQVEAEGAVRVSLATLQRVATVVPEADLRRGYVTAQTARAFRTTGSLARARAALVSAGVTAHAHSDLWLTLRVRIGEAVLEHTAGNYPAARAAFREVLEQSDDAPDLSVAAHLGLLTAWSAAENLTAAVDHAAEALRLARGNPVAAIEVLLHLGALCAKAGLPELSVAACEKALDLKPRPYQMVQLRRNALEAAIRVCDHDLTSRFAERLQGTLDHSVAPWDAAWNRYILAQAYASLGQLPMAHSLLTEAKEIAARYGYAELKYRISATVDSFSVDRGGSASSNRLGVGMVDDKSQREILVHIAAL